MALVKGSMVNRWNRWHAPRTEPKSMGHETSYRKAMAWLDIGGRLEDWGGGTGYARRFVHQSAYVLVDGSESKFRDVAADLTAYRPDPKPTAILLRHVLEHNRGWAAILENAAASFGDRFVLVTFTAFADHTHEIIGGPIPTHRFLLTAITSRLDPHPYVRETLALPKPRDGGPHYEESLFYVAHDARDLPRLEK